MLREGQRVRRRILPTDLGLEKVVGAQLKIFYQAQPIRKSLLSADTVARLGQREQTIAVDVVAADCGQHRKLGVLVQGHQTVSGCGSPSPARNRFREL